MSSMDFDKAFALVVGAEGGYSNDPRDPGGETMYGISKRAYPDEAIATMTAERAKKIYKRDYWDAVKGDQLPYPINIFVFDAAVNQGVGAAIKLLQKTFGVAQDGILGKDTLEAVSKKVNNDLCCLYLADRALRYTGTQNFDRFGRGWLKRLFVLAMEV